MKGQIIWGDVFALASPSEVNPSFSWLSADSLPLGPSLIPAQGQSDGLWVACAISAWRLGKPVSGTARHCSTKADR